MPLFQSKSKKGAPEEGKEAKQSLAIALEVRKKNKSKSGKPQAKVAISMSDKDLVSSVADAIMKKRKMAEGGEVEPMEESSSEILEENAEEEGRSHFDELNSEAAESPVHDNQQLSDQPESSNSIGGPGEGEPHSMVDKIRAKLKSLRD